MDNGRLARRTLLVQGAGFVGALTLGALIQGCGGGSTQVQGPGPVGSATFSITWPDRTRLIPAASNSIRLVITAPSQNPGEPLVVAERLIQRPAGDSAVVSSEVFDSLSTGNLTVTAAAYASFDATGVAQAAASFIVSIRQNENTSTALSLNSTIDRVQITPAAPFLLAGSTLEMVASALDSSGAVVITAAKNWIWTTGGEAVASLSVNGDRVTVIGLRVGTTTIRAVENESGKSAEVTTSVIGPVVAPNTSAGVESNESQYGPLQSQETTYQVQYSEALLGGLPAGALITGLQFRLDSVGASPKPAVDLAYASYVIRLAQTTRNASDLSLIFAENMLNPVTVYDAPLSLAAADFPTGASGDVPNEFGPLIRFTTPYLYRGGGLVLYLSHSASSIVVPDVINNGVGADAVRANPALGHNALGFSQFNAVRAGITGTNVVITKFTSASPTDTATVP